MAPYFQMLCSDEGVSPSRTFFGEIVAIDESNLKGLT